MAEEDTNPPGRGWKPVPDPTELTTQALLREIAALEDKLNLRMEGIVNTFNSRIDAMDKAQVLFEAGINRVPSDVTKQVDHLRNLHEEKFHSIQQQFIERDVRTDETSRSSKVAVDAALQAAKEAVAEQNRSSALAIAKSEAATDKRIDQMGGLLTTATSALDGKIIDIKDRITRLESGGLGVREARAEGHTMNSFLIAVIVAIISFIGLVISLASRFSGHV